MGCGSSSVPAAEVSGETGLESWRVWSALDQLHEADKTRLAKFFSKLQATRHPAPPPAQPQVIRPASHWFRGQPAADQLEVKMPLEVHTRQGDPMHLVHPLQPGAAAKLLQGFRSGRRLARLSLADRAGAKLSQQSAGALCKEAIGVLKREPTVLQLAAPSPEDPLLVVGDLHGNLEDLHTLIQLRGMPAVGGRRYVFNGDFVDRGKHGCEVLLTLLALKVVHPRHVFLIRGNHEDAPTTAAYGFERETIGKFSCGIFNLFLLCFTALPLCAVVGGQGGVFIVHAGVPRDPSVTLRQINQIDRSQYLSLFKDDPSTSPDNDQIVEDLTWSDPADKAGVFFGPDVAATFLRNTQLRAIVRSHEVMEHGCSWVGIGDGMRVWTVFSASNYSGGGNSGAVLEFQSLSDEPQVFRYSSGPLPSADESKRNNLGRLEQVIGMRQFGLLGGFQKIDKPGTGTVTVQQWASVMRGVLEMPLDWARIRPGLPGAELGPGGRIEYKRFLEHYTLGDLGSREQMHAVSLLQLYDNFALLRAVFESWDVNHDCTVDQQEFGKAVQELNKELPKPQQINPDQIFKLIDIDNSGTIDLNEFCESYRLVSKRQPKCTSGGR